MEAGVHKGSIMREVSCKYCSNVLHPKLSLYEPTLGNINSVTCDCGHPARPRSSSVAAWDVNHYNPYGPKTKLKVPVFVQRLLRQSSPYFLVLGNRENILIINICNSCLFSFYKASFIFSHQLRNKPSKIKLHVLLSFNVCRR